MGGTSSVNIQECVAKAKSGDKESFGRLYDVFLDRIYRFVYFRVRLKEDAEDLTEHIFLKVFTGIGSFEERGLPFEAWLYRIARNEIIDFYRTKKLVSTLDHAEGIPDTHIAPDEQLEQLLTYERVMDVLPNLPESYQEIIILKFIEDLDNSEISEIMQKPVDQIRVLQNRAIQKLRTLLNV